MRQFDYRYAKSLCSSLGRLVLRGFLRMASPWLRKRRSTPAAAYLGAIRGREVPFWSKLVRSETLLPSRV
jgi:hypothetical protein